MLASDKTLMGETNSAGSSSSTRYRSAKFMCSNSQINNELNPLPVDDAASPSSCSLNKLSSVCCSKLDLVDQTKKFCMACIGKWVSDVSEMGNFSVSNLITYLRTEFQSVHFTKIEEKLRVLEEECIIEDRQIKTHAENLETELRGVKDKCAELSLRLWNSESSKTDVEIDLKNYKLEYQELGEKVGKLEKVVANKDKQLANKDKQLANKDKQLANKDRELGVLKMRYRGLECEKKEEKEAMELELEQDISLNQYIQKVKSVSKTKSKALVEIEASTSQGRRKRGRKSLDGKNKSNYQGSGELVNVKSNDNKDMEEGLAAVSEVLVGKTKRQKKNSDSEASGKHGLGSNEGAVGETVRENVEHLDAPCSEKSSGEFLGAKVDKGLPPKQVYPPGSASCHQCKRVDRGQIVTCTRCKRRYCVLCIQKRYPELPHGEIEKSCPACQGFCNCIACLRKSGKVKAKLGSNNMEHRENVAL